MREWIYDGVPLGVHRRIVPSGILPVVGEMDAEVKELTLVEHVREFGLLNYASTEQNMNDAMLEVDRLLQLGYGTLLDSDSALKQFPGGVVSRLAILVKTRLDGSIKRRIIVDLLRSGANSRSRCEERIVLPRVADVLDDLRSLGHDAGDENFEMATADFSDAYMHLN
eukprot:1796912-Amphidinium_carterae.1